MLRTVTASIWLAMTSVLAAHAAGQERPEHVTLTDVQQAAPTRQATEVETFFQEAAFGDTFSGSQFPGSTLLHATLFRHAASGDPDGNDPSASGLGYHALASADRSFHEPRAAERLPTEPIDAVPIRIASLAATRSPTEPLADAAFAAADRGSVERAAWTEAGKFQLAAYGSFWANMLYATERTNPGPFTLFVPSAGVQGEDALAIDARRSRFGLNVSGPEIPVAGGLDSGGRVEVDFLGEFVTENQAQARIRHVYLELKNERHRILVGQTWDVISPLNPHTLNFSVGWMGGNIGFRRAQFRYERYGELTERTAWSLESSLNQEITPDFPTEPGIVRESGNYPLVELRLALKRTLPQRDLPIALGLSGHFGETGFDFLRVSPVRTRPQISYRFLSALTLPSPLLFSLREAGERL
jgi:hypothetical protein